MTPKFSKWIQDTNFDEHQGFLLSLKTLFGQLYFSSKPNICIDNFISQFEENLQELFSQKGYLSILDIFIKKLAVQDQLTQKLFKGQLLFKFQCQLCENFEQKIEEFYWIELQHPKHCISKALRINFQQKSEQVVTVCQNCGNHLTNGKLSIQSFPKVLVIPIKKFKTINQKVVKLQSFLRFKEFINLNKCLSGKIKIDQTESLQLCQQQLIDPKPLDIEERILQQRELHCFEMINQDRDKRALRQDIFIERFKKEKMLKKQQEYQQNKLQQYIEQGQQIYQLYCIFIHQGSMEQGQFWAYIKDAHETWYCFKDKFVVKVDQFDLDEIIWNESTYSNGFLYFYRKYKINQEKDLLQGNQFYQVALDQPKLKRPRIFQLKLTIIYEEQHEQFDVEDSLLVEELKYMAIERFQIHESADKFQLRRYQEYDKSYREFYEDYKTLAQQNIFSFKALALYKLQENNVYDPDLITLNVHMWQYDEQDEFERINNQFDQISISRQSTVLQLMQKLQEIYQVQIDQQLILKRSYQILNNQPEIISNQFFQFQSLSYAKLYNDAHIYLEQFEGGKSKWVQVIKKDFKKITILFNTPNLIPTEYTNILKIKKSKKLQTLRRMIARELQIDPNNLIMKRSSQFGAVLNQYSKQISSLGVDSKQLIYCEVLKRENSDQLNIKMQTLAAGKSNKQVLQSYHQEQQRINPVLTKDELLAEGLASTMHRIVTQLDTITKAIITLDNRINQFDDRLDSLRKLLPQDQ